MSRNPKQELLEEKWESCSWCEFRLTSRAQAQPPSGTLKNKMTNKSHKINRNWQGQRLLPEAPCYVLLAGTNDLHALRANIEKDARANQGKTHRESMVAQSIFETR
jgi:hypothetical protein